MSSPRVLALNILIGVLVILVVGLAYALVMHSFVRPPVEPARAGGVVPGVIQLDVLNGCGAPGAAMSCTAYLRSRGFDVVEMRNYKTFDLPTSLVIDRTGNRANAERVAYALGIKPSNIVQQINQDYYVDVSVVVGKDYKTLQPSQ
jgi:hypothetical protein